MRILVSGGAGFLGFHEFCLVSRNWSNKSESLRFVASNRGVDSRFVFCRLILIGIEEAWYKLAQRQGGVLSEICYGETPGTRLNALAWRDAICADAEKA